MLGALLVGVKVAGEYIGEEEQLHHHKEDEYFQDDD